MKSRVPVLRTGVQLHKMKQLRSYSPPKLATFASRDLTNVAFVARGGFGSVCKAKADVGGVSRDVAIKRARTGCGDSLAGELDTLRMLEGVRGVELARCLQRQLYRNAVGADDA